MPDTKPKIIVIAGPTASGKTGFAIKLARMFNGEIVSADSIQIYRYLDVGSAKPTREEMALVKHHMIDIRDPDEEFGAGDYVREARRCIENIVQRGKVPLVVGGTGLYIRCLLGGIVDLPPADSGIRELLQQEEITRGAGTLFARLEKVDPETAQRIDPHNLSRVIRALEVLELTGTRLSVLVREHSFRDRPYERLFICLAPLRSRLYERIDNRVDCMIKGGLFEEVVRLSERGYSRDLKSMQSLGYRHAYTVVAGEMDREDAVRLIKRDTRRYAKRQLTWFRAEPEVLWCDPDDVDRIGLNVDDFLGT
jgi:tRNA dimethylallyltransferase